MASDFKDRLNQACDESPLVPPHGKGRQLSISAAMEISQEAARKWFAGESKPRPEKMKQLAEYLKVELEWLALGIKPEEDRKQKRASARITEAAVMMVAGLIGMEGGIIAFPGERDPRADYVDMYAIMKGAQYAVYVSLGKDLGDGTYEFITPKNNQDVRTIGFIPEGVGRFTLIEMKEKQINDHKKTKAGENSIIISNIKGKFVIGDDEFIRFKTFGEII